MKKVTPEEFVIAYMEAWKKNEGYDELAKEMESTPRNIVTRKSAYRNRHGIMLPDLARPGDIKLNTEELKKIVLDYQSGRR